MSLYYVWCEDAWEAKNSACCTNSFGLCDAKMIQISFQQKSNVYVVVQEVNEDEADTEEY